MGSQTGRISRVYLVNLKSGGTPTISGRPLQFARDVRRDHVPQAALPIPTLRPDRSLSFSAFYSALNSLFTNDSRIGTLRPKSKLNCSQNILNKKVRRRADVQSMRLWTHVERQASVYKQMRIRCDGSRDLSFYCLIIIVYARIH